MTREEFIKRVANIQKELKAPKSQRNTFGNYNFRNQEDILEAVKPLLNGLVLSISDEVVAVGDRIYVKATATITDGVNELSNTALARETEEKKGMDQSQITGMASSYARKYSLNGLFLIDDTKDADTDEASGKEQKPSGFSRKSIDKKADTMVETKDETSTEATEPVAESTPRTRSFRRNRG